MKMYKKFITRFDTNEGYLYLSVKFISISNNLTSVFEKLLEKHQIQVNQYMSENIYRVFLVQILVNYQLWLVN